MSGKFNYKNHIQQNNSFKNVNTNDTINNKKRDVIFNSNSKIINKKLPTYKPEPKPNPKANIDIDVLNSIVLNNIHIPKPINNTIQFDSSIRTTPIIDDRLPKPKQVSNNRLHIFNQVNASKPIIQPKKQINDVVIYNNQNLQTKNISYNNLYIFNQLNSLKYISPTNEEVHIVTELSPEQTNQLFIYHQMNSLKFIMQTKKQYDIQDQDQELYQYQDKLNEENKQLEIYNHLQFIKRYRSKNKEYVPLNEDKIEQIYNKKLQAYNNLQIIKYYKVKQKQFDELDINEEELNDIDEDKLDSVYNKKLQVYRELQIIKQYRVKKEEFDKLDINEEELNDIDEDKLEFVYNKKLDIYNQIQNIKRYKKKTEEFDKLDIDDISEEKLEYVYNKKLEIYKELQFLKRYINNKIKDDEPIYEEPNNDTSYDKLNKNLKLYSQLHQLKQIEYHNNDIKQVNDTISIIDEKTNKKLEIYKELQLLKRYINKESFDDEPLIEEPKINEITNKKLEILKELQKMKNYRPILEDQIIDEPLIEEPKINEITNKKLEILKELQKMKYYRPILEDQIIDEPKINEITNKKLEIYKQIKYLKQSEHINKKQKSDDQFYFNEEQSCYLLSNQDLLNEISDIHDISYSDNIIVSIDLLSNSDLEKVKSIIDSILNQILKPKYLVINHNVSDDILLELIYLYDDIILYKLDKLDIISRINNLTKLNILDDDRIIFVRDIIDKSLLLHYEFVYELYNPDCVFIDYNNNGIVYNDNYSNWIDINLSYSFKFNKLRLNNHNNLREDILMTIHYKSKNLYACSINLNCQKSNKILYSQRIIDILTQSKINYEIINNEVKLKDHIVNFIVSNQRIRYLLKNPYNIEILYDDELYDDHYDIKYYNNITLIITLTKFVKSENKIRKINIKNLFNGHIITINLPDYDSEKITYFVRYNRMKYMDIRIDDYDIFQTQKTEQSSCYKFYSIMTVTNNVPYMGYKFFNDNEITDYLMRNCNILQYFIDKLIPGAYKSDLFRAYYIYMNGGIYFDCKHILIRDIIQYVNKKIAYVLDYNGGVYNAWMIVLERKNKDLREYIIKMLENISDEYYGTNSLAITGPRCLNKYVNKETLYSKLIHISNWINNAIVVDHNNRTIILNGYREYYKENNYWNTGHYGTLWKNKQIYNYIEPDYTKIKIIDYIYCIKTEINKDVDMDNVLKETNIEYTYINGDNNLTIPAKENSYALIIEDKIDFNNLHLFNETLTDIINNCNNGDFDILIITSMYDVKLINLYTPINECKSRLAYIVNRRKTIKIDDLNMNKNIKMFIYKYNYLGYKIKNDLLRGKMNDIFNRLI